MMQDECMNHINEHNKIKEGYQIKLYLIKYNKNKLQEKIKDYQNNNNKCNSNNQQMEFDHENIYLKIL